MGDQRRQAADKELPRAAPSIAGDGGRGPAGRGMERVSGRAHAEAVPADLHLWEQLLMHWEQPVSLGLPSTRKETFRGGAAIDFFLKIETDVTMIALYDTFKMEIRQVVQGGADERRCCVTKR